MKTKLFFSLFIVCISASAQQPNLNNSLPAKDMGNTPYHSPIIPIVLKAPVAPPTEAQAKDNLLWYKGKKIDDSTLITPQSTLVRWSKPRDVVIVQPKKDPFAQSVTELAKTEQRKEQFYNKVAERTSSIIMYPAINNTLKELDRLLQLYSKILKNTVNLPPAITPSSAYKINWRAGGVASQPRFVLKDFFALPAEIKKAYMEVMASMKNYPSIDFPAPPEMEFGACYSYMCDSTANTQLFKNRESWLEDFIKYEADIIRRSMAIMKTIGQSEKLQNDPETAPIEAGLKKAMEFATARIDNKTDLLIRKYGNDFKRLPAVVSVVISLERQKQLLGAGDNATYSKTMARLTPLFDGFEKFIEQQMDARNYDVALNMAFIIGMERQRQLLGASEENNMPEIIEKINAFNRFKIDVQIDYQGEWKGCGLEKASFTATNIEEWFIQLGLVGCKYNFFMHDEYYKNSPYPVHYGNSSQIPLKVTNGTGTEVQSDDEKCWQIKHDLKGLTIRPYEPIASISFCKNDTEDSLQFYSLHLPVSHENREDIRYNYARFKHFDTQIQNDGYDSDIPSEIQQMEIEMEELKMKFRQHEMKPNTKPSLAEMEAHHFEANRIKWLRARINEYEERAKPSVIVFDAKNQSEVIIDEKTNKNYYVNIPETDIYEKADVTVKIKITHAPLPYKTAAKK